MEGSVTINFPLEIFSNDVKPQAPRWELFQLFQQTTRTILFKQKVFSKIIHVN